MDCFVLGDRGNHGVHRPRIHQRLVTLNVHVDFGGQMRGDFSDAVGSGAMVGTGDDRFAAEGLDGAFDAGVLGGDDHARNQACLAHALRDALDHGFTGDHRQRLAREARGGVSRRNDGQNIRRCGICHKLDDSIADDAIVARTSEGPGFAKVASGPRVVLALKW